MPKTAIMIDGGFYRKRAYSLWGERTPKDRAEELYRYAFRHLDKRDNHVSPRELYRVFYYDCPPLDKAVYNPITFKDEDFKKKPTYKWANEFYRELMHKRKFALRMGRLAATGLQYQIDQKALRKLCRGDIAADDLTIDDFHVEFRQKGVDMKLGIDIASLAYEGIVDQIILIAGDSDFVPAAKIARRMGIDFILDPMGNSVNDDLVEHVDGLETLIKQDPLRKGK